MTLADETSGIVTATIAEGDLATLAALTGTGNAYAITIDDAAVDAAALNTLDAKTTVAIDAAAVNTLTGSAAELIKAVTSDGITGLGDETITIESGTATTLTDTSLTASVLNTLDENTESSMPLPSPHSLVRPQN